MNLPLWTTSSATQKRTLRILPLLGLCLIYIRDISSIPSFGAHAGTVPQVCNRQRDHHTARHLPFPSRQSRFRLSGRIPPHRIHPPRRSESVAQSSLGSLYNTHKRSDTFASSSTTCSLFFCRDTTTHPLFASRQRLFSLLQPLPSETALLLSFILFYLFFQILSNPHHARQHLCDRRYRPCWTYDR